MNRLLLSMVLLVVVPLSGADSRDNYRHGSPRVILYENSDFRGDFITLYPGDSIENLSNATFEGGRKANDRVSSIKVEGGAEVFIFTDSKYRGETLRVTREIRDLANTYLPNNSKTWNDQISSIRIEGRGYNRPPNQPNNQIDPEKVIKRAYQDILLREPDQSGMRDFRIKMIDQGWTEQQVRESLRRSDEFRGKVVNDMIGSAYRDLLGREPDANGLAHYRDKIIKHDWTEASVRDDIRKSDEYRKRQKH